MERMFKPRPVVDVTAIVNTFEPDGYFREPSGGIYVHRGREQRRPFMSTILGGGGIRLEHCTVTDDGVVAAIEFIAVQFGPHRLQPQAGLAVYERGLSGLLHAARIYDDVNVEALSGAGTPPPDRRAARSTAESVSRRGRRHPPRR